MNLPPVRLVLFDAVGTLIYTQPAVASVYHAVGQKFGSQRTVAEIRDRFSVVYRRFNNGEPTDEHRERERWRAIVRDVFSEVSAGEADLFEQLWQHFAQPSAWAMFHDVPPVWEALAERGYLLGIASNFDSRLVPICQALPPLHRAQWLFHSTQLGFSKPCREFFQQIERRTGLLPRQLLLVGDDTVMDYEGARAAGWNAILIDRAMPSDRRASLRDKPAISTLHELLELL